MIGRRIIRRTAGALAGAGTLSTVAVLLLSGSAPAQGATAVSAGDLLNLAKAAAVQAGDPSPTLIQHSEGTRATANLVASGDVVPGNDSAYLIVERGHFVASGPRPRGAAAPSGSVLTLVVDATTGRVTDEGIQNTAPDLPSLGPVTTDAGNAAG